jgi:hypothetical protein
MLSESFEDIPPTLNRTIGRLPLRDPVLEELPGRDATFCPLDDLGKSFSVFIGAVVAVREPQKPLQGGGKIIVEKIKEQVPARMAAIRPSTSASQLP